MTFTVVEVAGVKQPHTDPLHVAISFTIQEPNPVAVLVDNIYLSLMDGEPGAVVVALAITGSFQASPCMRASTYDLFAASFAEVGFAKETILNPPRDVVPFTVNELFINDAPLAVKTPTDVVAKVD